MNPQAQGVCVCVYVWMCFRMIDIETPQNSCVSHQFIQECLLVLPLGLKLSLLLLQHLQSPLLVALVLQQQQLLQLFLFSCLLRQESEEETSSI